ncbi:MAG TPA: outer membrane protein assembly factor BamB [Rubrivivax sp.]|nr:outer membrane protein assembly factor BamB [Rubrivivax sp.]
MIGALGRGLRGWPALPLLCAALALLAGCAADKPKPTPLEPVTAKIAGRLVWSAKLDGVHFPLGVVARDGQFVVAGNNGSVLALDAQSGAQRWRAETGAPLSAGVGSDGRFHAVVTADNRLVVFDGERVAWRAQLNSRVSTAPLVAGERVFVMGVDRAVHAFDALDGRKIWSLQRPGEALTLLHSGVLTAVKDTLVAGQGSRMTGIDPTRGSIVWEVSVGSPRGTNEVERLADLVGPALRLGNRLCVRSFQVAVGCADAEAGRLLWVRNTGGINAVGGDDELVVGADASDRILAMKTANGETAWTSERLTLRRLSAPASVGPAVVFGDFEGYVHFLDRKDGQTLLRLATDGSQVVGRPALQGNTLLVVTRNGGLFAFRPE